MESVIHYGQDSDKFLREFQNKWADYTIQKIADLSIESLKALQNLIRKGNRTFAEPV